GQRAAGAASVGPLERAVLREIVEVAPHSLGGHLERLGERRDAHGALVPKKRRNLRVTLLLGQPLLLSRHGGEVLPVGHRRARCPESSARSRKVYRSRRNRALRTAAA